jgi:hypothetical protein
MHPYGMQVTKQLLPPDYKKEFNIVNGSMKT